jgi:hypothetical protein
MRPDGFHLSGEEVRMDCPHCGKGNPGGSRFCANCGAPLGQVPSIVPPMPPAGAPQPGAAPAVPAQTSGKAIASLVLALCGLACCGLGPIFGLVLGIEALDDINTSGGRLEGRGLATAGIIVSAVFLVLALMLVLMFLVTLHER